MAPDRGGLVLARATAAAILCVGVAGCGEGAGEAAPSGAPPPGSFRLEYEGEVATARVASVEMAEVICRSVRRGEMANALVGMKEVRLSTYERPKPIECKVPAGPLIE